MMVHDNIILLIQPSPKTKNKLLLHVQLNILLFDDCMYIPSLFKKLKMNMKLIKNVKEITTISLKFIITVIIVQV